MGNGVFEETGSNILTLGNAGFFVNYLTGSGGQLSLLGQTALGYNALIAAGDFQINGVTDTNTSDFSFSSSGSQGILSLAVPVVPEPGTWAMLLSGLLLLIGIQRVRNNRTN